MANIIGTAATPAIPRSFRLSTIAKSRDIIMVHITPAERPGVPTTSPAIMNCMQEISFNTALIREMRSVALRNRRIDDGIMAKEKRILVHVIEAEDLIREFVASSRLNGDWDFLVDLFNKGRARAGNWLEANFDRIGVESTVDLEEKY